VRHAHHVVGDDTGIFHPLGVTLFWALYGWKFERSRILEHFDFISSHGFDYVRILGEVDWTGRSIEPSWPDYPQVIRDCVDTAYDRYGLRTEITVVGGRQFDKDTGARRFDPPTLALRVAQALTGAEHKVMHYECANEWSRLDKVSMDDLFDMAQVLVAATPNIVALSDPGGEREHFADDPDDDVEADADQLAEDKVEAFSGYDDMIAVTKAAGASGYVRHPRRSSHDAGWSHVRQGYDFKDFPGATWNNEPEGPQSSVVSMTSPLQLACCRLLGIMCGGAGYVLHVGQGVTGMPDPAHGRPANMWEVDNIDTIMRVVRRADALLPLGVENWQVVNNGRSTHPLPLDPHQGFWESGAADKAPAVNKNYAALAGSEFVVMLIGVKSRGVTGPVPAGTARRACHVEAFDPVTHAQVASADLAPGEAWSVPGRGDSMAAYVIRGHYLGVERHARVDRYV
jgi:hypothetical protein